MAKNSNPDILKYVIPYTSLGITTAVLLIFLVILMPIYEAAGNRAGLSSYDSVVDNSSLAAFTWIALIAGTLSIITGVLSIWKQKERSPIVITGTLFNATIALIFTLAILTD